jgi:hypothetical protein
LIDGSWPARQFDAQTLRRIYTGNAKRFFAMA